jgi:hypothetical protein
MTVVRLISPAARAGLLIAAGIGLIAAPALLGSGSAALITGLVVGALAIELGVAGTASEGRGTLPISAHAVYDRALAFGLFVAAAIFGLTGETDAAPVFAAAGALTLVVTSITRYSARPTQNFP